MFRYHYVAIGVAPKRAALEEAQQELAATRKVLEAAKQNLFEVEQGIKTLQEKFAACQFAHQLKFSLVLSILFSDRSTLVIQHSVLNTR